MFDPLDELEMAVEKVAAFEGVVDVERICRLAERVEFLRVSAIGRYDRSGDWKVEGFQTAAAGLRSKCLMVRSDAGGAVMLARKLESLPETAAAFGAGEISRRHAQVIARAFTPERAAMLSGIEAELVELARLTDPMVLRAKVRQMTDAFDGDGGAGNDATEYAKNRLTFDATLDGRFEPHGSFDPESGDIIATALAAEMEVLRQAGDTRSIPRQRAEALTSICRWYLAEHDHGHRDRRRGPTHLNIVWDLADLAGTNPSLLADVRAESAYASTLSRNTLERLACDCTFNRILMDGPSQIIDVGRSTRNIPEPLWKALVARDKRCTHPGCERGPGHCEAHHIIYWTNGGPTNLENLRLLCWYHHRELHTHDKNAHARPG